MEALFIGHAYIDVSMIADALPHGDEKTVAKDYAVSFGGNAATACFACAKLGDAPDLLIPVARDWLGHMFMDMAATYGLRVHSRRVARSSLSFIFPKDGKRSILRARDDTYLQSFPLLDLSVAKLLHLDGHMGDAALHYAKAARAKGVLVSLDGGALRPGIEELLDYVDVAVVAKDLCRQMRLTEGGNAGFSKSQGLPGRRRHQWRKGGALVRGKRRGAASALAACAGKKLWTPRARATCSTAPIAPVTSTTQARPGARISIRPRGVGP